MRFQYFLIFLIFLIPVNALTQQKYWVFYTDKNQVQFNPYTYFDEKALERRERNNLPLCDVSDFPLNESYLEEVSKLADSTGFQSRWLNAQIVYAGIQQITAIQELPFVKEVLAIEPAEPENAICSVESSTEMPLQFQISKSSELMRNQLMSMEGNLFLDKNITGKGVRIAVFDVGFAHVNDHPAFEHLRGNMRILKTWDFVKNREDVYAQGNHGRMVLSNIAGVYKLEMMGLAVDAEFLLARTEKAVGEPFSEEENWLAAAEWADKNGADIINSSLGYTKKRYFVSNMEGKFSLVSKAAAIAAAKGILVVNAMGNEGQSAWKYLGTPADADSILSIAGIDPVSGIHTSFSSFGPTADRRRKPNVSAFGHAIVASADSITRSQGTSFSAPLVSGFAACVMQIHPDWSNMQVLQAIEHSGSLYPYYDYAHGYGVPQASYFLPQSKPEPVDNFLFKTENDQLIIEVLESSIQETNNFLYYHIQQHGKSWLSRYTVVNVTQSEAAYIDLKELSPGDVVRVSYQSVMKEYIIK